MKIGLPRLRLSRKLLFITLGITVLLGGSGVTALYFGGQSLLVEGGENAIGGECVDIQTMVVKTPSNHLWLRKFIRMENASGHERVRTALRIAGNLAKNNAVDLIHVSVLDTHGPTKRADMRARAIGAEVLIALKPDNLPEMKSPAMASYYEGPVSDAGRFYGDKVVVDIDEIGSMMTAMRTVEEKPDCVNPAGDAEAAKNDGHGKTDKKDGHDKPKEGHDKPANDHGEKPANEHGEEPAEDAHAAEPVKEQSFVDSMMSMVGLGGEEEKAAESHEPPKEGDGNTDNKNGHAESNNDGEQPASDHGEEPAKDGEKQDAHAAEPAKEKSFVDSMLGMVGLGGDEAPDPGHEPAAEAPADAAAEDHSDANAANSHEPAPAKSKDHGSNEAEANAAAEDHAAPQDHEAVAEEPADAAADGHDVEKAAESHEAKPAATSEHEATDAKPEPVAEEHNAPAKHDAATEEPTDAAAKDHDMAKAAESHEETPPASVEHKVEVAPAEKTADHGDKPAETDAHAPAEPQDHGNAETLKSDGHAEAYMPVGD